MKFKPTYDTNHDTFRVEFLLGPCVICALIFNHSFTATEVGFIQVLFLKGTRVANYYANNNYNDLFFWISSLRTQSKNYINIWN